MDDEIIEVVMTKTMSCHLHENSGRCGYKWNLKISVVSAVMVMPTEYGSGIIHAGANGS